MEQITQAEALDKGLDRYFTGKPCKHGHVSERYAKSGMCIECARQRAAYRLVGGRQLMQQTTGDLEEVGIRRQVWNKSKGRCWYCGDDLPMDRRKYQIDHVIPMRAGGTDDRSNLVPSCGRCNNAKNNKTLEEFRCLRARQKDGRPCFSKDQRAYLEAHGLVFPPLPDHRFWFEEQGLG